MSRFLDNNDVRMLPRVATTKTAFLGIVSALEKSAIIEEGEGKLALNSNKLDLSGSIYEKD